MKIILTKNELEKGLNLSKDCWNELEGENVGEKELQEVLEKFKGYKFREITSVNYNEETEEYIIEINEEYIVDAIDTFSPIMVKFMGILRSCINMVTEFAIPKIKEFTGRWF